MWVRINSKILIVMKSVLFSLLLTSLIPSSSFLPPYSLLQATCLLSLCRYSSCMSRYSSCRYSSCPRAFALTLLSTWKISSHRTLPRGLILLHSGLWSDFTSSEILPWPLYLEWFLHLTSILYPNILINFSSEQSFLLTHKYSTHLFLDPFPY